MGTVIGEQEKWRQQNDKVAECKPQGCPSFRTWIKSKYRCDHIKKQTNEKKKHYRFLPTHQGNAGIHSSIPS